MTITLDTLPYAYEVQYHTTKCQCCGSTDMTSTFWAVHRVRERSGSAKQLVACTRPSYNLPVLNNNAGHKSIPYCGRCEIDLSHLPDLPRRENLVDSPGTLHAAAPTAPKKPTTPIKVTLEDLI